MSFLLKTCSSLSRIASQQLSSLSSRLYHQSAVSSNHVLKRTIPGNSILQKTSPGITSVANLETSLLSRTVKSLACMRRENLAKKKRKKKTRTVSSAMLDGCPQRRGVVLKVLIKKPKKPNSANRKCVRVRLTNGKEVTAFIPGEGHNLQEHSIVLCEGGKCQDVPGVPITCVRGKFDLAHVKKKTGP